MEERRKKWSKKAERELRELRQRKSDLQKELMQIRKELRLCGVDFDRSDSLRARMREINAELVLLS